jgi:hypothetical protein
MSSVIPGEAIVAAISSIVGAIVVLGVVLGRTRERIARIEEWIRRYEREEFDK